MQPRSLFSFIVLLGVSSASAQVPEHIHYQGRLIDGGELVNGDRAITIRLFDAETGPTELYAETQTVVVVDGLYSFSLGASNAISGALSSALVSTSVWLEVNVAGQTLTPRERLGAVAYALATRELSIDTNSAPNVVLVASGNTIAAGTRGAAIGGGYNNDIGAIALYSVVGGGYNNDVADNSWHATIAGGDNNDIGANATGTSVGGGFNNDVADGCWRATIAGGSNNDIGDADYATIAGGRDNNIGSSSPSTAVGGGWSNNIGENSAYAVVPGGRENSIGDNAWYAFAAGRRAKANHQGTFVWADSTNADFASTTNNEFAIRAAEGLLIANEAGAAKSIEKGRRFKDNAVIAWGRVRSDGNLDAEFGVTRVTKVGTGRYDVVLNAKAVNNSSLIPVVSPEIDNQPTSAAAVRIASYNTTGLNAFSVYMNNGNFASVDDDFTFIVTGR